jgi:L-fuconolactonase
MREAGLPGRAPIVDAQVHLGGSLYRPVEDYLPVMATHGIDQAVLVQQFGSTDNDYLRDTVLARPDLFVGVGAVEETSPAAPEDVHGLVATGAFTGLRITASARTQGCDPLGIWRALDAEGVVATVRGTFAEMTSPAFAQLVGTFPNLTFVLEHLGGFGYTTGSDFDRFLALSSFPNVNTMWSCFYRYSSTTCPYPDADSYLADSLAAFGADRLVWSGDWNRFEQGRADGPDDYRNARAHVSGLPFVEPDDLDRILGGTARSLYRLAKVARHQS